MTDDPPKFTIEESAALLKYIWPEYPGARGMRPVPSDLKEWLRKYREQKQSALTVALPHYG